MQITEKELLESIGRLTVENDLLRKNMVGLNNAVVQFLESDKKIKDKWVKIHGDIISPNDQGKGK